jgi:predicted transcriptional regulator
MGPAKIPDVLDAISDDASLELFKSIAITEASSHALRRNLQVTRRQYYFRLFKLVQCGLIQRRGNIYSLTHLGKVMYDAQDTIEKAMNSSEWNIKTVDA